jgi:integrase
VGSIERRERDGRVTWLARWRDPDGRQRKRSFRRRVDADRYLTGIRSALLEGAYVDPSAGRETVGTWAAAWLGSRVHLKPKTRASYGSLLRTRVLPRWRSVPLSRVTYTDVSAWVAAMRAQGLSASRTRQSYHLLTSMLDDAVRAGKLARNPAAGVDLPRLPASARRYLTHEQVQALAEACGEDGLIVLVLSYCGLRWGELAALRGRNVDLLRGRIEVVESVTDVDGRMTFGSPKSHAHRSVPLPAFLRDGMAQRLTGLAPDALVFASRAGTPLRVQSFRRRGFDRATTAVGLDGLTPHELRHTAASLAIAAGANVKAVQRMLGHASGAMTLDGYAGLFGDDLDVVAARLDAAHGKIKAAVPPACPEVSVSDLARRRASH